MLRRAGPSLRHFLLERKSGAGYSSYSGEVLNAQRDCSWPVACSPGSSQPRRWTGQRWQTGHVRKSHTGAISSVPTYFHVACLKGTSYKHPSYRRKINVGLPHLMVLSAKVSWVAKCLGNISIPLGDANMQSKEIMCSRDSDCSWRNTEFSLGSRTGSNRFGGRVAPSLCCSPA